MHLFRISLLVMSLLCATAAATAPADRVTTGELTDATLFADKYAIPESLAYQIVRAADRHGVARGLAFQLVRAESDFDWHARGKLGEIGLTQLLPSTARGLHPGLTTRQIYEPAVNLDLGMKHLASLLARYHCNQPIALIGYNAGTRHADAVYREFGYARRVLGLPECNL